MQMTIERKKAYTEILEIINFLGKSYSNKIPNSVKEYFQNNSEKDYKFEISSDSNISEQINNPITINLLGLLRYKYWCNTTEEKNKLFQTFIANDNKREKIQQEEYNPDNIFKKRNANLETNQIENLSITPYKKSIFSKIIDVIKKKFFKNI